MTTTRRDFLTQGFAGATLLATGCSLPRFLPRAAAMVRRGRDQRILVVLQMTGGNDGLNTVIPFRDDAYHRARPTLRIAPDAAHKIHDDLALHPDMSEFKRLYDDGWLEVVSNVGYPNPDRSHFRSMDIWHTANTTPEGTDTGWLGRVVDRGRKSQSFPLAFRLDSGPLPLALKTRGVPVPSITSVESLRIEQDAAEVERVIGAPRSGAGDDLLFVQRTAVSSCENAKRISDVIATSGETAEYPQYALANRLRQIAQLIGADLGPRIYYTSLGGFDTHARQSLAHGPLLRELSASVAAFYGDLKERGLADRVLLMTFSEFGRRVRENGSRGTDHGVGAPMFLAGPACRPGVRGGPPDLADLIDGDVRHKIDFRSVYATVLDDWLDIPHPSVLGQRYDGLSVLG